MTPAERDVMTRAAQTIAQQQQTIEQLEREIARLQRQLDRQHEGRSVRTSFADRIAWGRDQLRGGPPWRVS